jgi:hypothetical protein
MAPNVSMIKASGQQAGAQLVVGMAATVRGKKHQRRPTGIAHHHTLTHLKPIRSDALTNYLLALKKKVARVAGNGVCIVVFNTQSQLMFSAKAATIGMVVIAVQQGIPLLITTTARQDGHCQEPNAIKPPIAQRL